MARQDGGAMVRRYAEALPSRGRLGVGPAVEVLGLPESWAAAKTALRFAAEGTE
ncbi:hypothetical protein [Amycolatopsis alkalitolerans]|uniref:hypothetical protein n=1 Tax=Amycolatopsis alkalitolerans TaxID=2547244 RepID=UPI001F282E32|nr:hypothetical protein [Amycolatopsis alkalitolerans]